MLSVLFYYIFLKIDFPFPFYFAITFLVSSSVGYLYSLKRVIVLADKRLIVEHLFIKKISRILETDALYINKFYPPTATWTYKIFQLRLNKNDKVVFRHDIKDKNEEHQLEQLFEAHCKIKVKNWVE
jgi:hypothetical protein